jgi:Ankyrin repeats (3 copies)
VSLLPRLVGAEEGSKVESKGASPFRLTTSPTLVHAMHDFANALFEAIGESRAIESIHELVSNDPDLVKEQDHCGLLPLHYSLQRRSNLELVRLLADEYEQALREAGDGGKRPLHDATEHMAPLEMIEFLVDGWEGALLTGDDSAYLPLHYAVWHSSVWRRPDLCSSQLRVVQYLVSRGPGALRMRTRTTGELPLHKAVASGAPLELVELLVRKWEPALNEREGAGRLPLHCAAGLNGPAEVIQYLVDQSPRALQERDNDGRLPLHRAVLFQPVEGVRILGDDWERALLERDDGGYLPLHLAVPENGRVDVISYLVNKCPRAPRERDADGYIPLHSAIRFNSVEVVHVTSSRTSGSRRFWNRTKLAGSRCTMRLVGRRVPSKWSSTSLRGVLGRFNERTRADGLRCTGRSAIGLCRSSGSLRKHWKRRYWKEMDMGWFRCTMLLVSRRCRWRWFSTSSTGVHKPCRGKSGRTGSATLVGSRQYGGSSPSPGRRVPRGLDGEGK